MPLTGVTVSGPDVGRCDEVLTDAAYAHLDRLATRGDLFAPVISLRQPLPRL